MNMKRFLKRRWRGIPLGVIVGVALTCGISLAITLLVNSGSAACAYPSCQECPLGSLARKVIGV